MGAHEIQSLTVRLYSTKTISFDKTHLWNKSWIWRSIAVTIQCILMTLLIMEQALSKNSFHFMRLYLFALCLYGQIRISSWIYGPKGLIGICVNAHQSPFCIPCQYERILEWGTLKNDPCTYTLHMKKIVGFLITLSIIKLRTYLHNIVEMYEYIV